MQQSVLFFCLQSHLLDFLKITTEGSQITKGGLQIKIAENTGGIPITVIRVNIEDVPIIMVILAIEKVHMTNTVGIVTTIMEGTDMIIAVTGGLGINGTGMQDNAPKYTNMEGIIGKTDI